MTFNGIRKTALFLSMIAVALCSAAAIDLKVTYADGTVQWLDGKVWKDLPIGAVLDSDKATIRLDADSLVEFQTGKTRIGISAAGTYKLAELVNKKVPPAAGGVAAKIGKLTTGDSGKGSAVMGVRGDYVEPENAGATWASDDPEYYWDEGKAAFDKGDWTGAVDNFRTALSCAEKPDQAAQYGVFAATCFFNLDEKPRALGVLRDAKAMKAMEATGEYAGTYLLLLASVEAEFGNASAAKAVLKIGFDGKRFGKLEADARELEKSLQ